MEICDMLGLGMLAIIGMMLPISLYVAYGRKRFLFCAAVAGVIIMVVGLLWICSLMGPSLAN